MSLSLRSGSVILTVTIEAETDNNLSQISSAMNSYLSSPTKLEALVDNTVAVSSVQNKRISDISHYSCEDLKHTHASKNCCDETVDT